MSAHTKGPWTVYDNSSSFDGKDLRVYTKGGASHVATLCCGNAAANARLIAAAPEMLITLHCTLQWLENTGALHCEMVKKEIRAAIAKAEGRSQ